MEIQIHHTLDKPLKDAAHRAGLQPGVLVSHLLRAKLPGTSPRELPTPGEDAANRAILDFVLQHTDCHRRDISEHFAVSLLDHGAKILDGQIARLLDKEILGYGLRADTFFAVQGAVLS